MNNNVIGIYKLLLDRDNDYSMYRVVDQRLYYLNADMYSLRHLRTNRNIIYQQYSHKHIKKHR